MTTPRYAIDERRATDILAELRRLAAVTTVPGLTLTDAGQPRDARWSDVLFDQGRVTPDEPAAALVRAVAALYPGLLEHLGTLPDRALVDWLERRLGIPRLPVVSDRVVAVPTPDPKKLPVVVPAGTQLRGGRDVAGNERRYVTTETLSVLGTELIDVRSYRTASAAVAESRGRWTDRTAPFEPFPAGASVPHTLDIVTDVIRFTAGGLNVRLRFDGAIKVPPGLEWHYTTPAGLRPAIVSAQSGEVVDLQLNDACKPIDGEPGALSYIRVSLPAPPHPSSAFDLRVQRVSAEVVVRGPFKPDAGFYNDGVVDISKEFQPFGPVAKRGDSFYVQSEEAFAKPLATLTVTLSVLGDNFLREVAWGGGIPSYLVKAYNDLEFAEKSKGTFHTYFQNRKAQSGDARVAWQRYDGTNWNEFSHTDDALTSIDKVSVVPASGSHSQPFEVAGVTGRMVRAYLDRGDFGWVDYQDRIAKFAAEAARSSGNPNASDLKAPDPPIVSTITISYTTREMKADRLRAVNGWSTRDLGARDALFAVPLEGATAANPAGAIGFGLGVATAVLGATVSLFVDIEPAAACTTSDAIPVIGWEYWSVGSGWRPLDLVDGTAGLRQTGLIRFVAPADWAEACRDLSASTGRWIRIRTNLPERLGTIRAVLPDAVSAEYRSQLADPAHDPSPETPLKAAELKGLMVPIEGIKKFTNPLPGTGGRGPEPDGRYRERAVHRTRHRNRAIQAWDYEAMVTEEFPEVATVRCLPHTGLDDEIRPGLVGLVVVPWSEEPRPFPSVTLAERILETLRDRTPVHARPLVLCPIYVGVSVMASATLRPGVSASEAKRTLGAAIDRYLHPGADAPFGRELFASTMVRLLEQQPEIDHVTEFSLIADPCPPEVTGSPCRVQRVPVDACRGLVASVGSHALTLTEQL